jgi:hypothetical protein
MPNGFHLHEKENPLFDDQNLFSKHFISWHGHMDFSTCQNIDKEILWRDEMMGSMLLLMSLASTQGKSQYQCKCIKTLVKF